MDSRFARPAVGAFELCFRPWMRRRIHAVRLAGLPRDLPAGRPLILAANHVSWWDGFVLREVQRALRPRAPLHVLMAEAELARVPWFRLMGVIGVEAGSQASLARALRLLEARIGERPDAVVAIFPQGRIWPSARRPLGFRAGVAGFARRFGAPVLPVGLHLEPLNHPTPTVFAAAGEPLEGPVDAGVVERAVERQLDAILELLAAAGENAAERWPGIHAPLAAR